MIYFVYQTTNLINNKIYIGVHSTENIEDGYLGSGYAIKSAIRKYGKENFKRIILHYCSTNEEAYTIEKDIVNENFTKSENTYNIRNGGQGGSEFFTEESNRKISKSKKGKSFSDEHRKNLSESHKGHVVLEETKKKISKFNKGKSISEEQKKKISERQLGGHRSEETKKKISESKKGNIAWNKGIAWSDEIKQKMSESRTGTPWSAKRRESYISSKT